MASLRTHISFGIAAGILGVIGLVSLLLANAPGFLITVFLLTALGSVLPDIDSDSGIPFHVAFGSISIVACVLVFASIYRDDPNLQSAMLWTAGTGIFVWGVVGYIFRRFTVHRGMAHSVPA